MTETCFLEGRGDLAEWREAARRYLEAGIEPKAIDWLIGGEQGLFGAEAVRSKADGTTIPAKCAGATAQVSVPAAFLRLAQAVVCHADPGRFALLYRLLYRLRQERHLLEVKTEADVALAHRMQKSVARDYHKMTAFLRFKEVPLPAGITGRRRFLAWFEPDHFIVARVAPFFQRRFNDMDWIILTPRGSASWDGETLLTATEPAAKPDIRDETDDLWRTYYGSIFNPARLKVKMMMTEMPKKYWKNLPEAELIPEMIAGAEAKIIDMGRRQASEPLPFHYRLQAASARVPADAGPPADTIDALRLQARHCNRCDLYCRATQTVFGEGPTDAKIMVVGEQPGDQEDLAGRPFVGPAGRVFDEALAHAGLDRHALYVTNAVKHFKYELRGKRRIHQRPNTAEVQHCRWWLAQEIDVVKPKLIVAMGATALFALTARKDRLEDVRGLSIVMDDARHVLVTVHPSYLLRIPDEIKRAEELLRFRKDISQVGRLVS